MSDAAIAEARPRRPEHPRRRRAAPVGLQLPLAPSLEQRRLQIYLLLLLTDGLAIFAGFAFAAFLYFGHWTAEVALLQAQLILPLFWTIAIAQGAYSAGAALDVRVGATRVAVAMIGAVAIVPDANPEQIKLISVNAQAASVEKV